jgi:hypothetical protein
VMCCEVQHDAVRCSTVPCGAVRCRSTVEVHISVHKACVASQALAVRHTQVWYGSGDNTQPALSWHKSNQLLPLHAGQEQAHTSRPMCLSKAVPACISPV